MKYSYRVNINRAPHTNMFRLAHLLLLLLLTYQLVVQAADVPSISLMFWTIVAPEIPPAWALNQRLAAMTVRDVYNERKGVFSHLFR